MNLVWSVHSLHTDLTWAAAQRRLGRAFKHGEGNGCEPLARLQWPEMQQKGCPPWEEGLGVGDHQRHLLVEESTAQSSVLLPVTDR